MYRVLSAWHAKADGEGLGFGSLCCGDVGEAGEEHVVVVLGSESGFLRVFEPQITSEDRGGFSARSDEAACEMDLGKPIRQVEMAALSGATSALPVLAVLHEMSIALFAVQRTAGVGGTGELLVKPLSEHGLPAPGFSMGVFARTGLTAKGSVSKLVAMSENGGLTVVDGGGDAWYTRAPRPVLCPGPFLCSATDDRAVFCHGGLEVQGYGLERYLELYHTDVNGNMAAGGGGGKGPVWEVVLGEMPTVMTVVNQNGGANLGVRGTAVAILGDHSLTYVAAKEGSILGQRALDEPSVLMACTEGGFPDASTMQLALVLTHGNSLLAFHGMNLVWVASFAGRPIALRVVPNRSAMFGGYLCTLREDGEVTMDYLGTRHVVDLKNGGADPSDEVDYEAASEQYRMLQHFIAERTENGPSGEVDEIKARRVLVDLSAEIIELGESGMTILAQLKCGANGKAPLGNIHLSAHYPDFLDCPENSFSVEVTPEAGDVAVPISFFARSEATTPAGESMAVHEKDVIITAAYNTASGEPRVAQSTITVPLSLYAPMAPASPSYRYIFSVRSNVGAVTLHELLSPGGSFYPGGEVHNNQICMELPGPVSGDDRSCVVEDCGGGAFRVMAGSLSSLLPVLNALKAAFTQRMNGGVEGPAMTCQDNLPLDELGLMVTAHGELRRAHNSLLVQVEKSSQQFYSIQRRLLAGIGEKKDDSVVASLSSLLTKTYGQIVEQGHEYARVKSEHMQALAHLGNVTQLALLLLECRPTRAGMAGVDLPTLTGLLSPSLSCESQICGWEDRINAAMNYLSRLGVVDSPVQSRTRESEALADNIRHALLVSDVH